MGCHTLRVRSQVTVCIVKALLFSLFLDKGFDHADAGDIFLDDAVEQGKISGEAYYKVCRGNALKLLGLEDK